MEDSTILKEHQFILGHIFSIEDHCSLSNYFNQIFDSISVKDEKPFITIRTFENYLDLPMIICDKLFNFFDTEKLNKLYKDNFSNNLVKLYSNRIDTKINFFIHFFDFKQSNSIHIENLKIIFYFFHSITNNSSIEQIDQMLSQMFSFSENHQTMTTEECASIITNKYPSLFFLFYLFIYIYKPFDASVISYINTNNAKRNDDIIDITTLGLTPMKDLVNYVNNELKDYLHSKENIKEESALLFNKKCIFMKEHLLMNNSLYPLKNSFLENEKNVLSLFLCNNTELRFENEENANDSSNQFTLLYEKYHYCPKMNDFYYIEGKIGDGQFGMIKLCTSIKTKEHFAVKIIDKENKKINIQWEKDISKLLIKNHHTNVIKCYDIFETRKFLFIINEYLPIGNLNDFLFSTTILLTSKEINAILFDVLNGLAFLNKFYIIHRDIKPENILISKESAFVLTDLSFGKVVPFGETTDEGFGTPCYASPEIISRKSYDKATDLWSIGVLAYYLIYGQLPFDDDDSNLSIIKMKILNIDYTLLPPETDEPAENYQFTFDLINKFLKNDDKRITLTEFINEMKKK